MATNNENFIDDETRVEEEVQNTNVTEPVVDNEPVKEKRANRMARNVAAGAAGAVAGIGSFMAVSSFTLPDKPVENPDPHPQPVHEPPHFNGAEVPVAYNVNDEMNFEEAFSAARHEVGSGGVFEWHGGIYGTYYSDEWQGLSDEYQQSFSDYAYNIKSEQDNIITVNEAEGDPIVEDVSLASEVQPVEAVAEDVNVIETHESGDFAEGFTPESEPEIAAPPVIGELPDNDDKVVIINAQNVIVVGPQNDENEVHDITVVPSEVDGQDVAIVDTNLDENYEITVIDNNDDATPAPIDIVEDESGNITEGIQDGSETTPDMDQDTPKDHLNPGDIIADFSNDEDVSDF